MNRNLTDEDVEALACRVVEVIVERISRSSLRPSPLPPAPTPTPVPLTPPTKKLPDKLSYNLKELSEALGISKVSIYRLESRGLLKSLPYLRTKIYPRKEVDRFLEGRAG